MALQLFRRKSLTELEAAKKTAEEERREARREEAERRREAERRWYARLPIIAISTLCGAVIGLTALLAVVGHYTQPRVSVPPQKEPVPVPPNAPASAPPKPVAMSLQSKELFGYNSSSLRVISGVAQRELDACLQPDIRKIQIVGHADCIGSNAFNLKLSELRALAVKSYLTSKGVSATQITTEGQGEALASTRDPTICTPEARSTLANRLRLEPYRRVDIFCTYAKRSLQLYPTHALPVSLA